MGCTTSQPTATSEGNLSTTPATMEAASSAKPAFRIPRQHQSNAQQQQREKSTVSNPSSLAASGTSRMSDSVVAQVPSATDQIADNTVECEYEYEYEYETIAQSAGNSNERTARRTESKASRHTVAPSRSRGTSARGGDSGSTITGTVTLQFTKRDSDTWQQVLIPFVSHLAYKSVVQQRKFSPPTLERCHTYAAVMFCDLSGYSALTSKLKSAHLISSIVNEYLERLLRIVHDHGGDVLKFAGDAVLIAWDGPQNAMRVNSILACRCALDMLHNAGSHYIAETDSYFRFHLGICCGALESELFECSSALHMPSLYHAVSGPTMVEIGNLVDIAESGQIAISKDCVEFLEEENATLLHVDNDMDAKLLINLELSAKTLEECEDHLEEVMMERLDPPSHPIAEKMIHSMVLGQLSYGGRAPTQIAQMRKLCVLFIGMTSNGNSTNWLKEIQVILDQYRCPIVQIIDDDKGVHVVAAINLYEAIPEVCVLGIQACAELRKQQVGCAIGMAYGSSFCGVTGCSDVACRWDITGPAVVRAARLMQTAIATNHDIVVDQSLFEDCIAGMLLTLLDDSVPLKGSPKPIRVYTLSQASNVDSWGLLDPHISEFCDGSSKQLANILLNPAQSRIAVVTQGPDFFGQKLVCQRAAGLADLVPYAHVSEPGAPCQLIRTISTWFKYSSSESLKKRSLHILDHLEGKRLTRAHDECIELVNDAIVQGIRSCFVVLRTHFLDEFSLSLIHECLHAMPRSLRLASMRCGSSNKSLGSLNNNAKNGGGQIAFLCMTIHVYNSRSPTDLAKKIVGSDTVHIHVPIITVNEASNDELTRLMQDATDLHVSRELLHDMGQSSGHIASYVLERERALRKLSRDQVKRGELSFFEISPDFSLYTPRCLTQALKDIPVHQIDTGSTMLRTLQFDELPMLYQLICKVVALATRKRFYDLRVDILWQVLHDLIADGIDPDSLSHALAEMTEIFVFKCEKNAVRFSIPSLADIAIDVCTPSQIHSMGIALISRLECIADNDPVAAVVVTDLCQRLKLPDMDAKVNRMFEIAYKQAINDRSSDESLVERLVVDAILEAGIDPQSIRGYVYHKESNLHVHEKLRLDNKMYELKRYSCPLCFGPLALTINVITRNLFHEYSCVMSNSNVNTGGNDHVTLIDHIPEQSTVNLFRVSTETALERYLCQLDTVESFLLIFGHQLHEDPFAFDEEKDIIRRIASPCRTKEDVIEKAKLFLDVYNPRFLRKRFSKLHLLVAKFREDKDEVSIELAESDIPLLFAYATVRETSGHPKDAANEAFMTLAAHGWRPRPIPEYLPSVHWQSLCRLRDQIFRQPTQSELNTKEHPVFEFDIFLIMTAILHGAEDKGLYSLTCGAIGRDFPLRYSGSNGSLGNSLQSLRMSSSSYEISESLSQKNLEDIDGMHSDDHSNGASSGEHIIPSLVEQRLKEAVTLNTLRRSVMQNNEHSEGPANGEDQGTMFFV